MSEHVKKFPKEVLQNVLRKKAPGFEIVLNQPNDHSRWSVGYELIFREPGQSPGEGYRVEYSMGATESQDESPFGYEDDEVECQRVRLVEKLVKVWQDTETNSHLTLA